MQTGAAPPPRFDRLLRSATVIAGVAVLVLAAGFVLREPWALAFWPWKDGRLTYLFVGSIFAAMAVAILWIGASGEWRAAAPGALNVIFIASGMAVHLYSLYMTNPAAPGPAKRFAQVLVVFALANVVLFWLVRRRPLADDRPMPRLVFWSFVVFGAVLTAVGTALVLGLLNVMPWPLQPRTSVMIGLIFLGNAISFLWALLNPRWHNARAQLLSFLAHGVVLIGPLAMHYATVKPELWTSLTLYLAVLVYSALLAIWYLFIGRDTRRGWLPARRVNPI